MMRLIDTHTHLYLPEFDNDRDSVIERAISVGVTKLIMPNIDLGSVDAMLAVEARYPGTCRSMIGLHPTSVKADYLYQLDRLEERWEEHSFAAIGEIGIDLYWDRTFLKEQIVAFKRQVAFAAERGVPVAIHSRNSFPEVFEALEEFRGGPIKGVFHAFTGTAEDAVKAVRMGFRLGIGGIVTFKNSGLDKVVRETGIENIILETDSPYLAPSPHRGKRNESSFLRIINDKLAELYGLSGEEVAEITWSTSSELFGI